MAKKGAFSCMAGNPEPSDCSAVANQNEAFASSLRL